MEYEVCPTLLHMTSVGNGSPDLLILNLMPYPFGRMFPHVKFCRNRQEESSSVGSKTLTPVVLGECGRKRIFMLHVLLSVYKFG